MENLRIIDTGIATTNKTYEIFRSVIGQLSDGIWENAPMDGYWLFCDISDEKETIEIHIELSKHTKKRNKWLDMTDAQILKFFANRIKDIVLVEMSCDYFDEMKIKIMGEDFANNIVTEKTYAEYREKWEEYRRYRDDHPFVKAGKFVPDDNRLLKFLSYGSDITVTDAVNVRQELLSRIRSIK